MTDTFAVVIATALGAMIGSFLNVCIYRLPIEKSVVWPASACPHCNRPLAWFENIPIAAYLALGGRCRTCRAVIGWRYPVVEALTALMFAFGTWYFGAGLLLVSRLMFGCALIVLFAIDFEHHVLPNVITLPGIVVGFAFSFFTEPGWQASLVGIVVGGGSLWAVAEGYYRIRHEEGLGMGDVKMLAMIGAFLGWQLMILTLVLASFMGSIVGIVLLASRRKTMQAALPFGTFLAFGALVAAVAGDSMLRWYLSLYP